MRLIDYIQGKRRGKDANRLERAAMSDPFLQEALDGFDAIAGNHAPIINQLEKKFSQPAISLQRSKKTLYYWSVAASVLLVVGVGVYLFFGNTKDTASLIAINQTNEREEEISADVMELQMEQMDIPQQEKPIAARAAQKVSPMPTNPSITLEAEEISEEFTDVEMVADKEVMVAEMVMVAQIDAPTTDETVQPLPAEGFAKRMVQEEEKNTLVRTNDLSLSEVAAAGNVAHRKASSSISVALPFGEKEFQTYCQQRADKNVCSGQGATIELSFYVDEAGKPTKITFQKYTCEEAKKEIEQLLSSSPEWTTKNRKVNMTVNLFSDN